VFGVPLDTLPAAAPSSLGAAGHEHIPLPLALLGERLCGGGGVALEEEGVFRVAPSVEEREALRKSLDACSGGGAGEGYAAAVKEELCSASPISTAHLVKLFLRELPQPLLGALPVGVLQRLGAGMGDSLSAMELLGPREKSILLWLAGLLAATAGKEAQNKMSARNLAICVRPNLFAPDENTNPLEALMVSTKCVGLLLNVILHVQAQGGGGGPSA